METCVYSLPRVTEPWREEEAGGGGPGKPVTPSSFILPLLPVGPQACRWGEFKPLVP